MAKSHSDPINRNRINTNTLPLDWNEDLYNNPPDLEITVENLLLDLKSKGRLFNSLNEILPSSNSKEKRKKEEEKYQKSIEKAIEALPFGVTSIDESTGKGHIILVTGIKNTKEGLKISAIFKTSLPGAKQPLIFGAKDISFSSGQIGSGGFSRLYLMSHPTIYLKGANGNKPTEKMAADDVKLSIIGGESNTYVEWSCAGLNKIKLSGEIVFGENIITPISKEDYSLLTNNEQSTLSMGGNATLVRAPFSFYGKSLSDAIITMGIQPFHPGKTGDLIIAAKEVSLDFSASRNPEGLVLPPSYASEFGTDINRWTGLSIRSVNVLLGGGFRKATESNVKRSNRRAININNFIIDKNGVSTEISATDLLVYDKTKLGNWHFSVDEFYLKLDQNRLIKGSIKGKVGIPIFSEADSTKREEEEEQAIAYVGRMGYNHNQELEYTIGVSIGKDRVYDIKPIYSKITLHRNSMINLSKVNGEYIPSGLLHGTWDIKNENTQFAQMNFNDLKLQATYPIIESGSFSMPIGGDSKLGNFPLAIQEVGFTTSKGKSSLMITGGINFMDKNIGKIKKTQQNDQKNKSSVGDNIKGQSFSAIAKINFNWKEVPIDENNKEVTISQNKSAASKLKFQGITTNQIALSIDMAALKVKGSLSYLENKEKGTHQFVGNLAGRIGPLKEVELEAKFGATVKFRYWSMYASFSGNENKSADDSSKLGTFGFAGGALYHMSLGVKNPIEGFNLFSEPDIPKPSLFKPDSSIGYGVMGILTIASKANPDAMHGTVGLGLTFTNSGGLASMDFIGRIKLMANKGKDGKAPFIAGIKMKYDFIERSFHAAFLVQSQLESLELGAQVYCELYYSPNDWFVYLGRPKMPLYFKPLGNGPIPAFGGYFMVGTKLPEFPDLPFEVDDPRFDRKPPDQLITGAGKGFAFGAFIEFVNIEKTFPPGAKINFYFKLKVVVGLDVMVQRFNSVMVCEESGKPFGMNGWFAKGQIYAHMEGALGVQARLKFYSGRFDIVRLETGMAVLYEGPNPSRIVGVIAAKYSILGGLISGKMNYVVEMGEKCTPVNAAGIGDVVIIQDVLPVENDSNVDVFTMPQVVLSTPIGKTISVIGAGGNEQKFKCSLTYFEILHQGKVIEGEIEMNDASDLIYFNSKDVLPPNSTLTFNVGINFVEYKNGRWSPVVDENGKPSIESRNFTFSTGQAPKNIPQSNIVYSYPMYKQNNFHVQEYEMGYINLNKTQEYLLGEIKSNPTQSLKALFIGKSKSDSLISTVDYFINKSPNLEFEIPKDLIPNQEYQMYMLLVNNDDTNIAENVLFGTKSNEIANTGLKSSQNSESTVLNNAVSIDSDGKSTALTNTNQSVNKITKSLKGALTSSMETPIYFMEFRTSKYLTAKNKWDTIYGKTSNRNEGDKLVGKIDYHSIGAQAPFYAFFSDEAVDLYEIEPHKKFKKEIKPLYRLTAKTDNDWYKKNISPKMYDLIPENYLREVLQIDNGHYRDLQYNGLRPTLNQLILSEYPYDISKSSFNKGGKTFALTYQVSKHAKMDYLSLKSSYVNGVVNQYPNKLQLFSNWIYVNIFSQVDKQNKTKSYYNLILDYVLPGINKTTSTIDISIPW